MRKKKLLSVVIREKGNNLLSVKYNYHVPKEHVPYLLIQSALAMMNFDRTEAKKIVNELCDKKADEELEENLQKTRPLLKELDGILEANGVVPGELEKEQQICDGLDNPCGHAGEYVNVVDKAIGNGLNE